MRLLRLDNDGKISLIEFIGDDIPRYAILSHTWGADDEEVTYKDLVGGTGMSKAGYSKIRFCGKQAANDSIQFFWVDTCCIDKSSSAELSEAINSMFRWYHNAAKCYVYLPDVSFNNSVNDSSSQQAWKPIFRLSRWFTRGWTLQELLAPTSVEFFSAEGERLGDKTSLWQEIHDVTGISVQALRGSPLCQFNIDERMSWAETRETKRKEDLAYCMLGIFDIHMPLIYGEGREKAFIRLRKEIEFSLRDELSALSLKRPSKHTNSFKRQEVDKAPWIVPFERNQRFTGRESLLANIRQMLLVEGQTTKIAVMGLGGVGKTQLVLELIYQIREENEECSVIWIPATTVESLHQAYIDVARQLHIPGSDADNADVKRLVQHYLSKESIGQWVLVIDNADDIDMWMAGSGRLIEYLPRSKQGCIVFTTRDRKAAVKLAHQNVVEVREMNEKGAKELLQNHLVNMDLTEHQPDAETLLVQLTYLPLAIVQAAAYINENRITLVDYLALLDDQEDEVVDLLSEEFEDDGRYRNIKNPVATTWLISFEQIRHRDPLASDYLSFMACVDPKDIPLSLLPAGLSRKKETDAIGTLSAYSFIIRRPAEVAFDLHRLVHLATRSWLKKKGSLTHWAVKAMERLEEVFPNNDHQNRRVWRAYLTHAHYVLKNSGAPERTGLLWKLGTCLYSDGRYNEAEKAFSQVAETRARVLGEEHPDTLTSINDLASTYWNQGRWKKAEELEMQVLETRKRVLGEEHLDTLTSIANLASTLLNQGRWKEAEELFVHVRETCERVLGSEHPDTLTSINNLASTYWNQGRWKDAEELDVRVMETRKKVLGEEHPDTLTSMANLASTYTNQGRWKEAEELQATELKICSRVLGEEHPSTLASMANLAEVLRYQGKYEAAMKMSRQALEGREKTLGKEHHSTLSSVNNLALALRYHGKYEAAEKMNRQALGKREKTLGKEHPDTLNSVSSLAQVLLDQRKDKEAAEMNQRALEGREKTLGKEHPDTLTSVNNLAGVLQSQGNYKAAEELNRRALEGREKTLGKEHPDTLTSVSNLAEVLHNQGEYKTAEDLNERALEGREKALGKEHPDTLTSLDNLAGVLKDQGKYKMAEEMNRRVLEGREKALGREHPLTIKAGANLSALLGKLDRYEKAETIT